MDLMIFKHHDANAYSLIYYIYLYVCQFMSSLAICLAQNKKADMFMYLCLIFRPSIHHNIMIQLWLFGAFNNGNCKKQH